MKPLEQNNPNNQQEQEAQPATVPDAEQIQIPSKYRNRPSEVVEEMWLKPTYIDPEKDKAETERRQKAIDQIKANELSREAQKEKEISDGYSKLSPKQQQQFPDAQKDAQQMLIEHIQGQRDADGLLPEEEYVLAKLRVECAEFKKENPDKPFTFNILQGLDGKIYNNLVQKMSFKILSDKQVIADQEKANTIRTELGLPQQEIKMPDVLSKQPEQKAEQKKVVDPVAEQEQLNKKLPYINNILESHFKGKRNLSGLLTKEENGALEKLKGDYKKAIAKGESFRLSLSSLDPSLRKFLMDDLPILINEGDVNKIEQAKKNRSKQKLGIPTQEVKTSVSDVLTKSPEQKPNTTENEKAEQIKRAFEGMAGGVDEGVFAKVQEYDKRIKAVKTGKPMIPGDTEQGLLADFKFWTKQEWSEGFNINDFQTSYKAKKEAQKRAKEIKPTDIVQINENAGIKKAEANSQEKEQLLQKIKEEWNKIHFAYKTSGRSLDDEAFLAGHGFSPETGEPLYDKIDGKVGQFFDAHGIAKMDQLNTLLQLLETGIDPKKPFHTAPFEVLEEDKALFGAGFGTGGGTAYKEGIAVLSSDYKSQLTKDGIKYVFLNDVYASLQEPLQKLFPQYGIHLLSEQKTVLENDVKLSENKK